jgi:hypothetical protein
MSISRDFNFNFNMENMNVSEIADIMLELGQKNPGGYTVVTKLFELLDSDKPTQILTKKLIKNLITKNIVGTRLWYIYKNEANFDINKLLNIDLDQFSNEYFYDKFEKYTFPYV